MKLALYGFIIHYPVVLHFCLKLTKIVKLSKIVYILSYLPALFYVGVNFFKKDFFIQYDACVKIDNYWVIEFSGGVFYLVGYLYIFLCLALLIVWGRKTTSLRQKKQARILSGTLIIRIIFIFLEALLIPALTSYKRHAVYPIFYLIWMFGVWYAMFKYRFLSLTPDLVSKDIISNIDESIILADAELNILTINKKTEELIKQKNEHVYKENILQIFVNHEKIEDEIRKIIRGQSNNFSCRTNYKSSDNAIILMDVKFSAVRDRFDDIIGILVIGREVKGMTRLKKMYNITDRELQVIQYMVTGITSKTAAKELGVTLRTVKAHMTSIYNKLDVENKFQLLLLLKEFNVVSEHNEEKIIGYAINLPV
jgi:PAS domain S-box-containing protein